MRPYLEWLETNGFWVREIWSDERKRMIGPGLLSLQPHQTRILGHVLTPDSEGDFPYETVLYSCTKKSGKTALSASVGAWYAEESKDGTEIYVIANSQDQATGRVMRDLQYHFERRKKQFNIRYCKISEYRIDFPNGTFIQVLSNSFRSVAGSRHSLTIWDELWGATSEFDRRVWDEMTPISTVSNSLRWVGTYAGFENESDLLFDLYLKGIGPGEGSEHEPKGQGSLIPELEDLPCWKNENMFTYWDHEARMPWQTTKYLDEQRVSERPSAYLRLHENTWVTTHEDFIPIQWYDSATRIFENNARIWKSHPFASFPVTIGIDAGIRRDSSALVGVGYDSKRGKVGVLFHKIWTPTKDEPVDLEATVEAEILNMSKEFRVVSIVYDPTHLMTIMLKLQRMGFPVRKFEQTVTNMTMASQLLFDLFKNNSMEMYPDAECKRHIQMAVAETSSRGFRIVKSKTSRKHHIDYAVALAMACYDSVTNGGVDISIPLVLKSPYTNANSLEDANLPFPLRTEHEDRDLYFEQNY